MFVKVYDTHVRTKSGRHLHFDVVTPHDVDAAQIYAKNYVAGKGLTDDDIFQSRCQYCHSEVVEPTIARVIKNNGHYILTMLDYQG